jgi:hypothetical protein
MFDDHDQDSELKDKILQSLVDHMEDILGEGLKQRSGLGVEVQAEDPESLKEGLDQAKEAVDQHAPVIEQALAGHSDGGDKADGDSDEDSDLQRLLALAGDDDEDEKDKK